MDYDMFGVRRSGRTARTIQLALQKARCDPGNVLIIFSTQAQAQSWRGSGKIIMLPNLRISSLAELGAKFDAASASVEGVDHVFIDHQAAESYLREKYTKLIAKCIL